MAAVHKNFLVGSPKCSAAVNLAGAGLLDLFQRCVLSEDLVSGFVFILFLFFFFRKKKTTLKCRLKGERKSRFRLLFILVFLILMFPSVNHFFSGPLLFGTSFFNVLLLTLEAFLGKWGRFCGKSRRGNDSEGP